MISHALLSLPQLKGKLLQAAVRRFSLYGSASVSRLPSVCQELRSEAMKMKKFSLVGDVPTIMAAHFWVTGAVMSTYSRNSLCFPEFMLIVSLPQCHTYNKHQLNLPFHIFYFREGTDLCVCPPFSPNVGALIFLLGICISVPHNKYA